MSQKGEKHFWMRQDYKGDRQNRIKSSVPIWGIKTLYSIHKVDKYG